MFIHELKDQYPIELEIHRKYTDEVLIFKSRVDSSKEYEINAVVPEEIGLLKFIESISVSIKSDGSYKSWDCELLRFEESNSVLLVVLLCKSCFINNNRRESFRIEYTKDLEYTFDGIRLKGAYNNISSQGMSFNSKTLHSIGDKISLIIRDELYEIHLKGEILWVSETQRQKHKYAYGVSLNTDISKIVFRVQTEKIRNHRTKR